MATAQKDTVGPVFCVFHSSTSPLQQLQHFPIEAFLAFFSYSNYYKDDKGPDTAANEVWRNDTSKGIHEERQRFVSSRAGTDVDSHGGYLHMLAQFLPRL